MRLKKDWLLATSSFKGAMVILIIAQVLTRVLQFFKSIVISTYYGFGKLNDLYLYSSNVFGGLQGLFIESLSAGLIPFFSRKETPLEKERFLSSVLLVLFGFIVVFNLIFLLFLPWIQPFIAPGFESPQEQKYLLIFLAIFSLNSVLLMIERIGEAYLYSEKIFVLPQFSSAVGMVVNISLLFSFLKGNYYMLALSTLSGTFVSLLIIGRFLHLRWHGFDKEVWSLLAFSVPLILSGGLGMINLAVDRGFATGLAAGTISVLSYAFLMVSTASGLFSQIISKASFTYLSDLAQTPLLMNTQIDRIYRMYILGFILISFCFLLMGPEILQWIFLRGKVEAEDFASLLTQFIIYYPLLIITGIGGIVMQVFYIYKESRWPTLINGSFVLLNILLNFLWVPILGAYGLSLSTVFVGFCALMGQLLLARKSYNLSYPRPSLSIMLAWSYACITSLLFFPHFNVRLVLILISCLFYFVFLKKEIFGALTDSFS